MKICEELIKYNSSSKVIKVRGEDVPYFVEALIKIGKTTIGITGEDLFIEFKLKNFTKLKVLKKINWEDPNASFKKPAFCFLGPENLRLKRKLKIAINKKYYYLSNRYLANYEKRGFVFEKLYLNGATEESYILGISEAVIDIVYSGKSAKEAGLKVYDKIIESNLVIIGDKETLLNSPSLIKLLRGLK